jgi:signal transduction histidine kinase
MQKRIRQFGGALEIRSNGSETTIAARLPVRQDASKAVA